MAEQYYVTYARDKENPNSYFRREIADGNFVRVRLRESAAALREVWTPYLEEYDAALITNIKIGNGEVVPIDSLSITFDYEEEDRPQGNRRYELSLNLDADTPYVWVVARENLHAKANRAIDDSHDIDDLILQGSCAKATATFVRTNAELGAWRELRDTRSNIANSLGLRTDRDDNVLEPTAEEAAVPVTVGTLYKAVVQPLDGLTNKIESSLDKHQKELVAGQENTLRHCYLVNLGTLRQAMINGLRLGSPTLDKINALPASGETPENHLGEHGAGGIASILHDLHINKAVAHFFIGSFEGGLDTPFKDNGVFDHDLHESHLTKVVELLEARDAYDLPLGDSWDAVIPAIIAGHSVEEWPELAADIATLKAAIAEGE